MAKHSLRLTTEFVATTEIDSQIIMGLCSRRYKEALDNESLTHRQRALVLSNTSKDYRHVLDWLMVNHRRGVVFLRAGVVK